MIITLQQVQHVGRYITQSVANVKVGVIGGYHGINLGDIALGSSVVNILSSLNISSGLQTIYNLEKWKWPKSKYAIVGGGAVGYTEALLRVAKRYKNEYEKVCLLGVDFNEKEYSNEVVEMLKGAAWVSCRSEEQSKKLKSITGREDIYFHPDLAFSILADFCSQRRTLRHRPDTKKLFINVVPLYGNIKDNKIVPLGQYETERPELYESFSLMQSTYATSIANLVTQAIADGYEIETIPFTPMDVEAGKILLKDFPVVHNKYNSNPEKMIKKMSEASWILATRYHATIFALKLGIPITPIAYAVKNELLLLELGVSRDSFLSSEDLAKGKNQLPNAVYVKPEIISKWEDRSHKAIEDCIKALNL